MMPQDIERFNEWWFTGKIRSELALPFHRYAFSRIWESLRERQIFLVTGLRRVGKTTLLYQAVERLLENVAPSNILYFSFEESSVGPKEVLEYYEKRVLKRSLEDAGKVFVFFDEIQYVDNWSSVVKQFYDLYPDLKFFVSGSSSLLLSKEAIDKLAGRFFLLELKPLRFSEFLGLKGVRIDDADVFSRRMELYFNDYLRKSGFPEVANWDNEARVAEYIKNSVIDRVALRDIPFVFKTRNMTLMDNLIKLILSTPGCIINTNSLSRTWGESKITISNYLRFLETLLLVRSLSNFKPSFLASSRKLKKYYPATPSLVFAYSKDNYESKMGAVLESYVVNTLDAHYYFREGRREIDIIVKNKVLLPVEVKETVGEDDLTKFSEVLKYINAVKGVIVSSNQTIKRESIEVIPAYMAESLVEKAKIE
ncbi:MAG TPA: ATP-binding protein [Candidatus Bathyarchaeia archaeon]|nr:ATP-binding protein [Candidatus Bathyarchaeia archaeon]